MLLETNLKGQKMNGINQQCFTEQDKSPQQYIFHENNV